MIVHSTKYGIDIKYFQCGARREGQKKSQRIRRINCLTCLVQIEKNNPTRLVAKRIRFIRDLHLEGKFEKYFLNLIKPPWFLSIRGMKLEAVYIDGIESN